MRKVNDQIYDDNTPHYILFSKDPDHSYFMGESNNKSGVHNRINSSDLLYHSMSRRQIYHSTTTVREKCRLCEIDIPCCESGCEIYQDKTKMNVEACKYCPHSEDDVCYAAAIR